MCYQVLNSFGESGERKRAMESRKRETNAPSFSNYTVTCKFISSRRGKEVKDSRELSVTAEPLAGDDDDDKFELSLALNFSNQTVKLSGSHFLHIFRSSLLLTISS